MASRSSSMLATMRNSKLPATACMTTGDCTGGALRPQPDESRLAITKSMANALKLGVMANAPYLPFPSRPPRGRLGNSDLLQIFFDVLEYFLGMPTGILDRRIHLLHGTFLVDNKGFSPFHAESLV